MKKLNIFPAIKLKEDRDEIEIKEELVHHP